MNQTRGTRQEATLTYLNLCHSLIDLTLDSNPHLNPAVVPFCRYAMKLGFGSKVRAKIRLVLNRSQALSSLRLMEVNVLVRADKSTIGKVEAGCFGSLKPEWLDFKGEGQNI